MRDRPTRRNSEAQKHRRMNIFALPSRRNPGAVLLERKNKASKAIILLLAVTLALTFWAGTPPPAFCLMESTRRSIIFPLPGPALSKH